MTVFCWMFFFLHFFPFFFSEKTQCFNPTGYLGISPRPEPTQLDPQVAGASAVGMAVRRFQRSPVLSPKAKARPQPAEPGGTPRADAEASPHLPGRFALEDLPSGNLT